MGASDRDEVMQLASADEVLPTLRGTRLGANRSGLSTMFGSWALFFNYTFTDEQVGCCVMHSYYLKLYPILPSWNVIINIISGAF